MNYEETIEFTENYIQTTCGIFDEIMEIGNIKDTFEDFITKAGTVTRHEIEVEMTDETGYEEGYIEVVVFVRANFSQAKNGQKRANTHLISVTCCCIREI